MSVHQSMMIRNVTVLVYSILIFFFYYYCNYFIIIISTILGKLMVFILGIVFVL
jgi:hypothetical protein